LDSRIRPVLFLSGGKERIAMKTTSFNGSPRGRNSISHIMASEFLEGAQKAGAEGSGGILKAKHPLLKPIVQSYRKLLRKAGEEVVREGRLSEKTMEKLENPLVPHDRFAEEMNNYFVKRLESLSPEDESD
jgi:hypothetical protein